MSFPNPHISKTGCVLLALLCGLGGGCGGSDGRIETFPVKGQVLIKGRPVTNGSIVFTSTDPTATGAIGRLDQDGRFSLMTYEPDDGAPAGEYKVVVRAFENLGTTDDASTVQPKSLVPRQYTSLETTPLRKTITAQEVNTIDIEI
jgi:hypothetical protein